VAQVTMDWILKLVSSSGFMPHGYCYTWDPYVIWLHVISDGLIAIAYFSIPLTLLYLVLHREDLPLNWMFLCFAVFIVACGATHAMEIWSIWRPMYWLSGAIKAITALASVATAVLLIRLIPPAVAWPSTKLLSQANLELQQRTDELQRSNLELEQLAAACQSSDAKLLEAQRLAQIGSWEWHIKPERITWSEELYRIYRLDSSLPPPSFREHEQMLRPESWSRLQAVIEEALQTGKPYQLDLELSLAGSASRWLVARGECIRDESGQVVTLRGTVQDITERMQVEEMQRKQAQLLGLAHDAIFVHDGQGLISYWNPAAEQRYGWKRQEALGKHADTWLQTAFPQPLEEIRAILFETDYWEGELTHTSQDGSRITVESRWSLQRDQQGRPAGTLEIDRDVTEREHAKEALKESEERFRFALDGSPITVFNHDRLLRYSWIHNPALNGYQDGDCIGLTDKEILGGEEGAQLMDIKQRVMDTGMGIRTETSVSARGDRRFLDLTVEPLRNAKGTIVGVTCSSTDVTALRRSEQQVRALNADLELRVQERTLQLQAANTELEAFSSSVSHDLRAPLRRIDGFSRILLEDYADKLDEVGTETLSRVRAASQNMAQLIEDLLNLSKVTRVELQTGLVHVGQLAKAISEELSALEPQRAVEWVIDSKAVVLKADIGLLRIVMENLLGNAWKFTRERAVPKIEFGVTERNGEAVWYVRDNGAGFNMTYAHKLFSPFQRLHSESEFPGTGIGLATVRRIIHRHGGRVWGEGVVEKGATFYFTLPT
jgi:PAS domain S-box-containing protein